MKEWNANWMAARSNFPADYCSAPPVPSSCPMHMQTFRSRNDHGGRYTDTYLCGWLGSGRLDGRMDLQRRVYKGVQQINSIFRAHLINNILI